MCNFNTNTFYFLSVSLPSDDPENENNAEINDDYIEQIRQLLKDESYTQAAKLIIRLDVVNREQRVAMEPCDQVLYFIALLRSYLFNEYVSE